MSHLIRIRHASPTQNLPSILCTGLDPARSRSRFAAVWLHTASRSRWALPHVASRHAVPAPAVSLVTVLVPRSWLSRRSAGVWYCRRPIPPANIVSVNPFACLA